MTSAGSPPDESAHPAHQPHSAAVASVVPLVPAWRLDRAFDYAVPDELRTRVRPGTLVRVPLGARRVRGIVVGLPRGPVGRRLEEIIAVVVDVPVAPPPLTDLLGWIARRYAVPVGRAFGLVVPPRVRVESSPAADADAGASGGLLASYEGAGSLVDALDGGRGGLFSLRPVPGHDRGALVSELVSAALRAGRGAALVAVPEVRYGSIVIEGLEAAFPGLARVDTAVSAARRSAGLLAVGAGAPVGIGGRAAVLAPAPTLALIVLDEEHHPSFKEDRSPRYHARRVAVERARLQGAVCVLVSPTPSLEVGAAVLDGSAAAVEPSRNAARAARPIVEVVRRPDDRALAPALHDRIRSTLRSGDPVALLVPRRGFARAIWCASCRRSVRCPVCEAGLFYDRQPRRVRCARCGYENSPPDVCPACGAHDFVFVGAGSERLAEQLAASFPRATVRRVDPEVVSRVGPRQPPADIYVTTWIGTKETLRPPATLVGVLDADVLIRRPDFRAAERAHQALAEMSEWAGPASDGGRLVIQTREPVHHSVQAVARADYRFFMEHELEQRRELSYPPFSDLVKVTASGPRAGDVIDKAQSAARRVGARILGPITIRSRSRSYGARPPVTPQNALEILVKCDDALEVSDSLRGILASTPAGTRLSVDADPR